MRIALTGATGFVGRAVVSEFMGDDHSLTALVRNAANTKLPIDVRLVTGAFENAKSLDELMHGADVVIHIAGAITAISRDQYFMANQLGTRQVAEAAARNGVRRFVHISSLSAREPQLSAYGASKSAGEKVLEEFSNGISIVILRPPAVYGPGDKATLPLLKALTQKYAFLPGVAPARFSLIYVADLARIIVEAAGSAKTGTFELDDGKPAGYDWKELAQMASRHEQKIIVPIFFPKVVLLALACVVELAAKLSRRAAMISRDKIRELYHPDWVASGAGWPLKNPVGFAQGFATTVQWYRQNGWLPNKRA